MSGSFKAPPNPWFFARTTPAATALKITPGTKVAVRQSRSGGWRVCSAHFQIVVSDKFAPTYLTTELDGARRPVLADQTKAEEHFQRLLQAADAARNAEG